MADKKFDVGALLPEGTKVESISIKAPEDPEDKAARLRREFWTFVVKDLLAHAVAFLFGSCCVPGWWTERRSGMSS